MGLRDVRLKAVPANPPLPAATDLDAPADHRTRPTQHRRLGQGNVELGNIGQGQETGGPRQVWLLLRHDETVTPRAPKEGRTGGRLLRDWKRRSCPVVSTGCRRPLLPDRPTGPNGLPIRPCSMLVCDGQTLVLLAANCALTLSEMRPRAATVTPFSEAQARTAILDDRRA